MSAAMRMIRGILLITVGVVLVVWMACKLFQWQWYLGAVPAQIEVDGVVSVADSSGFREGCGAAVFALSRGMLDRLQEQGLAALADARQGRDRTGAYSAFGAWQKSPSTRRANEADLRLSGMECGGLDETLQQRIYAALSQPGAYYASASESSLIVIPSLQIVVFTFFG